MPSGGSRKWSFFDMLFDMLFFITKGGGPGYWKKACQNCTLHLTTTSAWEVDFCTRACMGHQKWPQKWPIGRQARNSKKSITPSQNDTFTIHSARMHQKQLQICSKTSTRHHFLEQFLMHSWWEHRQKWAKTPVVANGRRKKGVRLGVENDIKNDIKNDTKNDPLPDSKKRPAQRTIEETRGFHHTS